MFVTKLTIQKKRSSDSSAEGLKEEYIDLLLAHCLTPPLMSSFLHAFLITTPAQYCISGGNLGIAPTPALPFSSSLDEGLNVNLSTRLKTFVCLIPEPKVEVPGPVGLALLLDAEILGDVGLSNAFSFPFFIKLDPDVDADAAVDAGGPPIVGLSTLLPLNVLK